MALVFLDRQHAGKGPGSADYGAASDLDGDGRAEVHEQEAMLTPVYLLAAEIRLRDRGHVVVCLSDGSYAARHQRAIAYAARALKKGGRAAYVAAHLNAGGGNHGLVVHDPRSAGGKALAIAIAATLGPACPELSRVVVGDTVAYPRALSTIRGVYDGPAGLSAVCFEPCFLDQPAHRPLLTPEGFARIGWALADGVHRWVTGGEE